MVGWTLLVGMTERVQEQPEQLELELRELRLGLWVEGSPRGWVLWWVLL